MTPLVTAKLHRQFLTQSHEGAHHSYLGRQWLDHHKGVYFRKQISQDADLQKEA